jgi:FAD/FMN-containing dehydrogenase/NAD-dependent dihydropyrimidine dehydrogenase PreA subunit
MSRNALQTLAKNLAGDLLDNEAHREVYATDASMYYLLPQAIVLPRNVQDVQNTLQFAAIHNMPITARGAGTSTAGQATGEGIILDFSRYLNRLLHLDLQGLMAEVEPGMVYKNLNQTLKPHHLFFPVNPSSGKVCTLGGMLANNASGPYSVKYGATKDNVLSLKILLCDGRMIDSCNPPQDLVEKLQKILAPHCALIKQYTPQTRVNSSGYNLFEFMQEKNNANGSMDLTKLFIGSEGTLGLTLSAQLKLTPRPNHHRGALLTFDSLETCAKAVACLLPLNPCALEILDDVLIEAIRKYHEMGRSLLSPGQKAILFLQFDGATPEGLGRQMQKARKVSGDLATKFKELDNIQTWWQIRKTASPLLHHLKNGIKPLKFIEDGAVPPNRLAEYVQGVKKILEFNGVSGAAFGHAGNGHIHINPKLNPRIATDQIKLKTILEQQTNLVLRLGGTLSGEHGDGILRTQGLKQQYGPLVQVFREIKNLFDPLGILNPGKILNDDPQAPFKNWRYFLKFKPEPLAQNSAGLQYEDFLDQCHGCGLCRQYCPPFLEGCEEMVTGRAKAQLLRGFMAGNIHPKNPIFQKNLDLCGSCSLCLEKCPNHIDISLLCRDSQQRICPNKA